MMKLIFHSVLLIYSIAHTSSELDFGGIYPFTPPKNIPSEYDPKHKSHYLDADPHLLDSIPDKDYHNNYDVDNDLVKQLQKDEEWEKRTNKQSEKRIGQEWDSKYSFDGDEVKPKRSLEEESVIPNKNDIQISKSKRMKILSEYKKHAEKPNMPNLIPKVKTAPKIDTHLYQIDPVLNANVLKYKKPPESDIHMDSVLNAIRRNPNHMYKPNYKMQHNFNDKTNLRRKRIDYRRRKKPVSSSSEPSSSSREMKDFKEEFRELWLHKKFEAINQSRVHGDKVNMVAARPWGVPCGDPNQHDMPWGTCMLNLECEPEYRVYRGDLFCGRTRFICCALQLTTYDMYQGFDVSFDSKSLSTDSGEKRDREKPSKEKRKHKKARERRKRRKAREKRKKKIKKHIKKIVKEIRKILNKQYKNGTRQRKKRTKQLKKFIKDLKKQYRKDRQSVKDLHESDMLVIDSALMARLKQIQKLNHNFATNTTFREVLLKGTMTKKVARMLLDAYPELDEFLEARRAGGGLARRAGGGAPDSDKEDLEYDVEYGYLYY